MRRLTILGACALIVGAMSGCAMEDDELDLSKRTVVYRVTLDASAPADTQLSVDYRAFPDDDTQPPNDFTETVTTFPWEREAMIRVLRLVGTATSQLRVFNGGGATFTAEIVLDNVVVETITSSEQSETITTAIPF